MHLTVMSPDPAVLGHFGAGNPVGLGPQQNGAFPTGTQTKDRTRFRTLSDFVKRVSCAWHQLRPHPPCREPTPPCLNSPVLGWTKIGGSRSRLRPQGGGVPSPPDCALFLHQFLPQHLHFPRRIDTQTDLGTGLHYSDLDSVFGTGDGNNNRFAFAAGEYGNLLLPIQIPCASRPWQRPQSHRKC
jgi:hypothetical protein